VAYHVSGQLEKAEKVLTIFEGILEDLPQRMPTKAGDYDRSELLMYHATILEEMGKHEEALAYLEQWNSEIVDRQAFAVFRGG
jgi:predicted Zn-dependent protease with MMP-like domain